MYTVKKLYYHQCVKVLRTPPFVPPSALFEPVVDLSLVNVLASLIERKLVRYTPVDISTKYDLSPYLCDGFAIS